MSYELSGVIEEVFDTNKVSDRFQKREFVVRTEEENNGRTFTDYVKFQLLQDRVDLIDGFEPGQQVKVHFDIKGNRWEKDGKVNFFTNLNAWRIQPADENAASGPPAQEAYFPGGTPDSGPTSAPAASSSDDDDLPF
jgi:hypothetical protein